MATVGRGRALSDSELGRPVLFRQRERPHGRARARRAGHDDGRRRRRQRAAPPRRAIPRAVALPGRAARPGAARQRGVPQCDCGVELRQRVSRHLPDQGQPAARGRRRVARRGPAVRHGPRVRVEGRADRVPAAHRRRDAARLQRRQRSHDAVVDDRRPEARPEHRARHGEVLGVHRRQGSRVLDGLHVAARRARAARDARRRPLGRVVGHELEVRLERGRAHAHGQRARGERPTVEARAVALPHRQSDRGHPGAQGGDQGESRRSTPSS